MTEPRSFLLAWRLAGRRVLVVGGGDIGTAKVETLQGTGAEIVVVDPTPTERVRDLVAQYELTLKPRRFRPWDLRGAALVIAATGDSTTNRRIRRWARLLGVVVNAVDDPQQCDVTVPAVIHRGPVSIAITTGGSTPAGARFLREELTSTIDAAIPEAAGQVFTTAAEIRTQLKHEGRYRYDYRVWRNQLFEPGLGLASRGASLEGLRQRFLTRFDTPEAPRAGKVSLVGAGPGGVDLITVRGANVLKSADCVIYDRLADPDLVNLAPPAAQRIPVGKGKGHGVAQEDINRLLIEHAVQGDNVVRLKGGDPFVFGRGSEEVDALCAAGIDVDVIPGLSSALAGPALAGISVTDRRSASSFTVVTGHAACSREKDSLPPPSSGTLVVLMAASTADRVAAQLCDAGWPPATGTAFVHAAGTERQQSFWTKLEDVRAQGCPFPSPTVMLVGGTVQAQPSTQEAAPTAAEESEAAAKQPQPAR